MELTRREMLAAAGAAVTALVIGGWKWLRVAPARWVQAVRAGRYPGRVKPLDERELRQAGRWVG